MDKRFNPVGYKQCNLCGFQPTATILRGNKRVHEPQHRVLYRSCPKCGMLSMDMDYKNVHVTYKNTKNAAPDKNYIKGIGQTWRILLYIMQEEPTILQGKGKFAYDVGCGAGGSLEVFKTLGYNASGCELQSDLIEFTKRKGFKVTEDYTRSSLPQNSADFLYCYHVLEHIARPFRFLTTMNNHLKPNGLLYIEVPNALDASIYRLGFGHISMFMPFNLKKSISNAGFRIIAEINRLESSTPGVGILAKKHRSCRIREYDNYTGNINLLPLAFRVNYAFFLERPRDLYTIEILYRFLFLFPFFIIKRIIKKIIKR